MTAPTPTRATIASGDPGKSRALAGLTPRNCDASSRPHYSQDVSAHCAASRVVGRMAGVTAIRVRDYSPAMDAAWAVGLLDEMFGGRLQARRGQLIDALGVPGLVAVDDADHRLGMLMYQRVASECELVAIAASRGRHGVGTALLEALQARLADGDRIWLVTTNDNLDALRFYQRRGFSLCALRAGAVDDSRRRLKPSISLTGAYGIPLRDELELELHTSRKL